MVSAGADETLRLWKCFIPDAIKKSMVQKNKSADQSALRGFIRWKIISSQDIIIVTYEFGSKFGLPSKAKKVNLTSLFKVIWMKHSLTFKSALNDWAR